MRGLCSFALLLYLSILCTPQAFEVHDLRLSPLADTQFHAITPSLSSSINTLEEDTSDIPVAALLGNKLHFFHVNCAVNISSECFWVISAFFKHIHARAPPFIKPITLHFLISNF